MSREGNRRDVDAALIATTFAVVFLAELPDKTALAGLVLATKYPARYVFTGAAFGFGVQVVIALALGSLLGLLPHRPLETIVGVLFLGGAVLMVRQASAGGGGDDEDDHAERAQAVSTPWKAVLTSFTVITIAEFGDLTQVVTANLAAKYDWLSVGIGALAALCSVAALAIVGGRALLRVVPVSVVARAAALVMAFRGVISLISAARG